MNPDDVHEDEATFKMNPDDVHEDEATV